MHLRKLERVKKACPKDKAACFQLVGQPKNTTLFAKDKNNKHHKEREEENKTDIISWSNERGGLTRGGKKRRMIIICIYPFLKDWAMNNG